MAVYLSTEFETIKTKDRQRWQASITSSKYCLPGEQTVKPYNWSWYKAKFLLLFQSHSIYSIGVWNEAIDWCRRSLKPEISGPNLV